MDLSQYSIAELKNILASIPKELERRKRDNHRQFIKELEAKAAGMGLTLTELAGAILADNRRQKPQGPSITSQGLGTVPGPGKYRHPIARDVTWDGVGRKPTWVKNHLAQGGALEDLTA